MGAPHCGRAGNRLSPRSGHTRVDTSSFAVQAGMLLPSRSPGCPGVSWSLRPWIRQQEFQGWPCRNRRTWARAAVLRRRSYRPTRSLSGPGALRSYGRLAGAEDAGDSAAWSATQRSRGRPWGGGLENGFIADASAELCNAHGRGRRGHLVDASGLL
jgi:hypothetical protein